VEEPICPKCQHSMEIGFILENDQGAYRTAQWADGTPIRSVWTGLKMKGKLIHQVDTYRCKHCGYLESYARGEGMER
jgi:hypothetical protein